MKIKIVSRLNANMEDNQIKIILEHSKNNTQIRELVEHLKSYKEEIIVRKDNQLLKIPYKDIVIFYSKGKENFCRTKEDEYKVKSRLYEIEKLHKDFVRISKKYIVNFNHVRNFDIGEIGKIVIKLDNGDTVNVSRRKIKNVIDYLDERSI